MVLKAGSPRSGCQQGPVLGESSLPGLQTAIVSLCPHTACFSFEHRQRAKFLGPLFGRALILLGGLHPYDLIPSQSLSPNTITFEIRVLTYEFGGMQTFSP